MSKIITLQNAGSCTAYELRQELVRRGAFDLEESKVNFRSMLERLVRELVAEEQAQMEVKTSRAVEDSNAAREAAKAEREKKKQEAIERSRQRQAANPGYFKQRAELNQEGKKKFEAKTLFNASSSAENDGGVEENDQTEENDSASTSSPAVDDDPFRSYAATKRNKIFVR